jgi:hypothetical protein
MEECVQQEMGLILHLHDDAIVTHSALVTLQQQSTTPSSFSSSLSGRHTGGASFSSASSRSLGSNSSNSVGNSYKVIERPRGVLSTPKSKNALHIGSLKTRYFEADEDKLKVTSFSLLRSASYSFIRLHLAQFCPFQLSAPFCSISLHPASPASQFRSILLHLVLRSALFQRAAPFSSISLHPASSCSGLSILAWSSVLLHFASSCDSQFCFILLHLASSCSVLSISSLLLRSAPFRFIWLHLLLSSVHLQLTSQFSSISLRSAWAASSCFLPTPPPLCKSNSKYA